MTLKRGRLSTEDEEFILSNFNSMSIDEIASTINREAETVKRYIRNKKLSLVRTKEEEETHERLLATLRQRPYWSELKKTLFDDEIIYFEQNWINFILDLAEDISFAEELILADWIVTRILHLRSMQQQKAAMDEITRIQRELTQAYAGDKDDPQVLATISAGETQLAMAKSSVAQITRDADKLFKQAEHMHKSLKTDRQERRDIKTTADTYWDYVAQLDNEKFLKEEGRQAELMRLAAKKAKLKLMENHKYLDGEVSPVLLSDDSILLDDEDEEYGEDTHLE